MSGRWQGRFRVLVGAVAFQIGSGLWNGAQAQNFPQFFDAVIKMGVAQASWNGLDRDVKACMDRQLRQDGESVQGLAARGVMANDPALQPYVVRCQTIADAGKGWRGIESRLKACVERLLQTNSQSIQVLTEMGISPSDSQVASLFSQCRQIEAARRAWASIDGNVSKCVDRVLQNSGQSISLLVEAQMPPSDQQVNPVMTKCQLISSQNLLKNISCVIDGLPSRCDEFYVLEWAQDSPLDPDQLAAAHAAGEPVGKAQIESPSARTVRLQRLGERRKKAIADGIMKKLGPLLDPGNKFAFARASELRKQVESKLGNAKTSEEDLLKLDVAANALLAANTAEIERKRTEREEMAARGEVLVSGEGSGANEKAARTDTYYQIFEKQLRDLVGSRADDDIGQQFKRLATSDFAKFHAAFFVGGAREACRKRGKTFVCSVEGVFKAAALKTEVQRIMIKTVSAPQRTYRFILGYRETDDEATRFLIDNIRAEFINAGYLIIARSGEEQAIAQGAFDFYLNILDIAYDDSRSDVGSVGGAGANVFENYVLKARVKLLDNANDLTARRELANVPVINTKRLPRETQMPREVRRNQLLPMQAKELARQVFRDISDRILTLASDVSSTAGTVNVAGQYVIRIKGVSQRDREQIRALRKAVSRVLSGTETVVDPAGTNDHGVEIRFTHADKFDPEDIVDALYEAFKDHKKTFKVRYEGSNNFVGSL